MRLPTSLTREARAGAAELRVAAGDRDVVEEDLAVGVAAGADEVGVEQEPAARTRPALHDQQGVALGEGVHGGGVDRAELAVGGLRWVRDPEGDRRGGIVARPGSRPCPRRRSAAGAALGTEARIVRVLLATGGAERHWNPPRRRSTPNPSRELRLTVSPNLSAAGGAAGGRTRTRGAAQPSRPAWYAAASIRPSTCELRRRRHDLEQPAGLVGVAVHQLGGGVEDGVGGDDLAGHRGVDVADRLGRLQLAAGVARR